MSKASSDLSQIETADAFFWFVKSSDEVVGNITLQNINKMMMTAEIGYGVLPKFRGQGLATPMVRKLTQECFSKTKLRKLIALVHESNIPSRKVLEKIGYHQEGLLREHYLVNGEPTNEVIYGILRNDVGF